MADPDVSNGTGMFVSQKQHDVPVDNLDYGYIGECTNAKELEKILKVLRSGKEGRFPDLEKFTEEKLSSINPNSRALRKEERVSTPADVGNEEWSSITNGLEDWTNEMKSADSSLKASVSPKASTIPPVRSQSTIPASQTQKPETNKVNPNKRVKPRDYREWDKVNIDEELAKVDQKAKEDAPKKQSKAKPAMSDRVNTTGLSDQEKEVLAVREKDKGNEAFRAGDYGEALTYYNRSLSVIPSPNSYNNRALTHVKLEMWDQAIMDLNKVLAQEPDNIKAFLRRGVAYKGKKEYVKAKKDLQQALSLESTNKRAKDLLLEVTQLLAKEEQEMKEKKEKGRRLLIEDIEGSDEDEEEEIEIKTKEVEAESDIKLPNDNSQGKRMVIEEINDDEEEKEIVKNDTESVSSRVDECSSAENRSTTTECASGDNNVREDQRSTDAQSNGRTADDNTIVNKQTNDLTNQSVSDTKNKDNACESKEPNVTSDSNTVSSGQNDGQVAKDDGSQTEKSDQDKPVVKEIPPPPPLPVGIAKRKDIGNSLFKNGQYAEAIAQYSHAIDELLDDESNHPFHMSTLYSNRAACKSKIGDCRGCIHDCNFSLELIPHSLKPLLRRASAYEIMEKYKEAYIDYKHSLAIDSSIDMAHQGAARCQSMLQQLMGPKWRQNLPSIPSPGTGNTQRQPITTQAKETNLATTATTSSVNSQSKMAASTEEKASKTPLSDTQSVLQQEMTVEEKFDKLKGEGNSFVQKGKFEAAAESYTGCIALCPNNPIAYTNRALCYIRLNKAQHAESDTTQALNLDSENVKALFRRAQARKMLSHYKESLEDLTKLLKIDPKNSAAKRELDVVKNYWREELNAKKAEMPKQKESNKKTTEKDKPKIETLKSTENVPTKTPPNKHTHTQKKKHQASARKTQETHTKIPSVTPKLEKATPYEFMQAWNSLKKENDIKMYAELVSQIAAKDLPKVLSNKLDDHMLTTILKCIEYHFIEKGEVDKAFEYLENLTRVPRFQMVALFMSDADKSYLKDILEKTAAAGLSNRDTQRLQMLYNL